MTFYFNYFLSSRISQSLFRIFNKPTGGNQPVHELGIGFSGKFHVFGQILNFTLTQVYLQNIAGSSVAMIVITGITLLRKA